MVNKSSLETNLIGSCASKMKRQWITEFSLKSLNQFVITAMSACWINKRLEIIPFLSICYMSQMFVISLTLKYHMKYQGAVCIQVCSALTQLFVSQQPGGACPVYNKMIISCVRCGLESTERVLTFCMVALACRQKNTQLPFPLFPVYTLLLINKRQKDLK